MGLKFLTEYAKFSILDYSSSFEYDSAEKNGWCKVCKKKLSPLLCKM